MTSVNRPKNISKSEPVIAFVIEELSVGGAEHMLMVMANEFVSRGWQVHMICLTQAGELASRLDESIQLHVLNKTRGIDPSLPWRIIRCIGEIRPAVVNSHLWVANAWTRLSLFGRTIPVVVTEHSRDSWKPVHFRWMDRLLTRNTVRMVTVSADTASFYEHSIGIDRQLITVVNNGVDTQRYARGCGLKLRQGWLAGKPGESEDKRVPFLIGTVGRLVAAKNHLRLIDACARLMQNDALSQRYDIHLKLVGEGPERTRLQRRIDALGLGQQITLTGTRHDIPDVLAAFDVFVLSSDREGHPLTALEAQAAGTPVVLTDAGGSSEAIARDADSSGGLLVSPCVDALTEALRKMLTSPELRAEQSAFARQYALDNFDKQQMIDRYEAIFRRAFVKD